MNTSHNIVINNLKERPLYQIKVQSSSVNFDIRINDFPIFRFFEKSGGVNMEYPINQSILNSGEQILTIKVFPIKGKKLILSNNIFKLEVNKQNDAWIFDNEREILVAEIKMIIPENGLPYWEYKTKFNAVVPYELNGWKKSKKLNEIENIESKLANAYNEIKYSIEQKNNEKFILLTKNKVWEEGISLYEKESEDATKFQEEKETILPFNNCIVKFYGNNRLIRLENEKGESCLNGETMENGEIVIYNYPILFHIPEGSDELEIIR